MPVKTFGNQVGVCWVVCVQMSFPKLVLRASIKVGNEEKFFAMRTSLLNLKCFFLCSAMHTICYPGEVILACLPK